MTQPVFNYIENAFSQIIDDIAGNPDWGDAARAVASDLGTLERKLEKRVTELPSNIDEAAEEYGRDTFINECMENGVCDAHDLSDAFKAGAEWMAWQGVSMEINDETEWADVDSFVRKNVDGKAILQIRKKQ